MPSCPNCGKEIWPEAKFCTFCGEAVKPHPPSTEMRFCPNCGLEIDPSFSYCPSCGRPLKKDETRLYSSDVEEAPELREMDDSLHHPDTEEEDVYPPTYLKPPRGRGFRFYKSDGKESIGGAGKEGEERPITLDEALKEVEELPYDFELNFLGFINGHGEILHLVRYNEGDWYVEVPLPESGIFRISGGTYDKYYWAEHVSTRDVKALVTAFFRNEKNWMDVIPFSLQET